MLSEYKGMWLFIMFDLPVDTRKARKNYAKFRKQLLDEGFQMMQYSIYSRYCASEEVSTKFAGQIQKNLPPAGQVRFMAVTDRQFGKMKVFYGKKRAETEQAPQQMQLF